MRHLLPIIILLTFITPFVSAQNYNKYHTDDNRCENCTATDVETQKTVTYHQYVVEEFSHTQFEEKYLIQYAIVSDVTSMPSNAMAMSFQTNQGLMYMIVSKGYYSSKQEAIAIADKVRTANPTFCNYFVKKCLIPVANGAVRNRKQVVAKKSNTSAITRQVSYQGNGTKVTRTLSTEANGMPAFDKPAISQTGNFRVQYTWTKHYPTVTLEDFIVESHNGGFRQVSAQTFDTREGATKWVQSQGYSSKSFWVYGL